MPHALLRSILAALLLVSSAAPAAVVGGRVLDAGGGPAVGVDLDFVDRATGANLPLTGDVTDALGLYSVTVPASRYEIRYAPPQALRLAPRVERDVRIDADLTRPDLQLEPGWLVSGTLLDHAGAPVAGADLDFYQAGTPSLVYTVRDDTDAAGRFAVLVPCGVYDIVFEPPVGHPDAAREMSGIDACADTDLGNVALALGGVIQGTVALGAGGVPVAGADLDAIDPATGEQLPTPHDDTDAAGFYSLVVEPGTWRVGVDPPQGSRALPDEREGIVVTAGGTTVVDFALVQGVILEGTVTSAADGSVVEGADLDVIDPATAAVLDTPGDDTDLQGAYSVIVPPGIYDLRFDPPAGSALLREELSGVDVRADTVQDAVMQEGVRLIGRVVRATDLAPLAGIDLDIYDASGSALSIARDDTGSDGRFVVAVPPGTGYSVDLDPPDTYVARRLLPVDVTADLTDLGDGFGNADGDLELEEGVEVFGTVRRASDAAALEDVDLDFVHASLGTVLTPHDDTDAQGLYRVWVPAGDYAVDADPPLSLAVAPASRDPVVVSPPSTGPIDFDLEDAALVTGLVVDGGTGAPLSAVDLDFDDPASGLAIPTGPDDTAADGTIAVRVPPGDYEIDFEPAVGDAHIPRTIPFAIAMPQTDLGTVELEAGAFLRGRVLRASDLSPVADVDLDVDHPTLGRLFTLGDDTLADGTFQVTVPAGGGYAASFLPPPPAGLAPVRIEPVDVPPAGTDLGDILLFDAVRIEGRVLDPGARPAPDVDLDLWEAGTSNVVFTPDDRTDGAGRFSLAVPAGTYDLRVQPARGTNLAWERRDALPALTDPLDLGDIGLTVLLAGIAPASGPSAGGTPVTVTGNRFTSGTAVALGGSPLQSPATVDPNTATGVSFFHPDGLVDVTAEYSSGELGILRGAFEYMPPAEPILLLVGRFDHDVLLTWSDTGQPRYIAGRSDAAGFDAPTVVFQGAANQAVDAGAAADPGLYFYSVE